MFAVLSGHKPLNPRRRFCMLFGEFSMYLSRWDKQSSLKEQALKANVWRIIQKLSNGFVINFF
jgi:hypothetical protein